NVLFDSSVHQPEINTQVVVHQDVPESSQPLPINRRLRGLDAFAQLLTGLGQRLGGKKALTATSRVLLGARNATQDVPQVDAVVLHKWTASSSTRSRSKSSRPRSVTTCTRRPRSSSNSATSPPGNQ